MTRITVGLGLAAIAVVVAMTAACGGANQQPASESAPAASAPGTPAAAGSQDLKITLNSTPTPPKAGENAFEVMVMSPDGKPVTDADVSVEFYMAAMPSMKMPEMRNRVDLKHEADGRYRGSGNVMMAGDWDVTVKVARGGQEIGSQKSTVTAK